MGPAFDPALAEEKGGSTRECFSLCVPLRNASRECVMAHADEITGLTWVQGQQAEEKGGF